MWMILVALGLGVAAGALLPLKQKHKAANSKIQHAGVVALLFFMGISIGLNKDLLLQLQVIGFKSLVFGLLTTACSIAILAGVTTALLRSSRGR